MRRLIAVSFFSLGLAAAGGARAEGTVELGVGLIGSVGGNFLDKADRTQFDPDVYPGFGGLTLGGGLLVDVRLWELIGVEVDVIRSNDKGSGTVTLNGVDFDVTLGQAAWHVPVLAKLTLPAPVVAPMFFVGPEFVFPADPETEIDSRFPVADGVITATADDYMMITLGGGLEIKPPFPVLDLRIPVTLRFSYNPSVSSDFSDRVVFPSGGTVRFDSEWKYAAALTAGVAIWF